MTLSAQTTAAWLTTSFALLLVLLIATSGLAQVPQKINYQVMLTDDADQPLADQSVTIVFTVYDDPEDGTALWTETQNLTTNSIGVVSALIGDVHPIDFELTGPVWLEVEVDGETLSPRRELATAPYAAYAANSAMLGGTEASKYAKLSDLGGLGDGHSLDAADGSPVDAVYVDSDGQTRFRDVVEVGAESGNGSVRVYESGNPNYGVRMTVDSSGGSVRLQDESNHRTVWMEPDPSGTGGLFGVARDGAGNAAFAVDGNYSGEAPRVYIQGPSRLAVFDMTQSESYSVQLPDGAIDRDEIFDEPGIASIQSSTDVDLPAGQVLTVAVRTIIVPTNGYMFVLGTAEVELLNEGSEADEVYLGVSDVQNAWSGGAQEQRIRLPGGTSLPYAAFYYHGSVSGVFEVTAGQHNFYLNAQETSGTGHIRARQLTLMFFPTAYGGVDTTD